MRKSLLSSLAAPPDASLWLIFFPGILLLALNMLVLRHCLMDTIPMEVFRADAQPLLLLNSLFAVVALVLRWCVITPWRRLVRQLRHVSNELASEQGTERVCVSMRGMAGEIARRSAIARESYQRHIETSRQLADARSAIQA